MLPTITTSCNLENQVITLLATVTTLVWLTKSHTHTQEIHVR